MRGVSAASTASTSMLRSSSEASTTTGRPPACVMASSVATNVFAWTTTSSPGWMSAAIRASLSASSPLATPTQSREPQ